MKIFSKYSDPIEVLRGTPGPSPWYLKSDPPEIDGVSWEDIGCDDSTWGKFALRNDQRQVIAIIGQYCYIKALDSLRILLWHADQRASDYVTNHIRTIEFWVIDLREIGPITDFDNAILRMNQQGSYLFLESPHPVLFELSMLLEPGKHSYKFPSALENMEELLVLGESTAVAVSEDQENKAHLCIFSLNPRRSEIEVFPQDWFNQADLDFGYQWVTRVARDHGSGKIYGEGIRISHFVLGDTNREIEKSFHDDPFDEAMRQLKN